MVLRYENSPLYEFYNRMCNNLISLKKQKLILDIIYQCLKEYEQNLVNKEIMFIAENKCKILTKEIAYFPKSAYKHLTGVKITSRGDNKELIWHF